MKRIFTVLLTLAVVLSLAACGSGSGSGSASAISGGPAPEGSSTPEAAEPIGEIQTVGNITLAVPDGWVVTPGDAGGLENDDSLFLREKEDAREFLWIKIAMDEASVQGSLESNSEPDIDPFEIGGAEWSGKVNMVTADVDGVLWLVMHYGFDFTDSTIQAILGSLEAAA